ncbi:flagellar basal-body rod protein FlgB [Caldicoprobacter guelmensis]|uniref:flagellar basal body rod protein FlgB n=1 Tax=Caldicoprobacter guelmensis TaxID=1170224 RepID=UPI001FAF6385|nr:flagellar basal body rod protein FlgB [Caldicoprobacter guelmensis]MBM7581373.1 flagellar basal-body rod protein FlgB [Caldicoprobacter guelmensis]
MNRLFSNMGILEKALDAAWLRNEVIAHNIANADTPGYKKYKVVFEEELKSAIEASALKGKKTRPKHLDIGATSIDQVSPRIVRTGGTQMREDGNNVDMDEEMTNLAKNSIMYNALVQKIAGEFRKLKAVINEGRR